MTTPIPIVHRRRPVARRLPVLAALGWVVTISAVAGGLEADFREVPAADRPWVYWWWLKGNVTESSITRDLEAMKGNGIGGLLMFDARGYHEGHVVPPPSRMEFMSPEWRGMLRFALGEASRLGLEVSVNLSSCAGALKGPWDVGADAPKKLVWTAMEATGGQRLNWNRPRPEGTHFHDVALLAVRRDDPGDRPFPGAPPVPSTAWRDAAAGPAAGSVVAEVVDLSGRMEAEGRLSWDAPAGRWTLLRFGWVAMDGHEYDVDILDPAAVTGHFERMGREILRDAGPLAGKTLTHFYSVSWEGAAPTWTPKLEREFETRRGYALRPWLPVLAGFRVKSADESDRFRRDYFKTLGDCFADNFYGTLHNLCRAAGLRWHSESGGPWDRKISVFEQADQLAFLARNDMPQGEFWFGGRGMNRPAAMTAHIYGRRLAATEAFTHMVQHWSAYPAVLKPDADAAFCDGSNHLIWHTFTSSPPELGLPGSEYFAGTHFNPNVTWWPMARPFVDYLARCQFLLRQGAFVADLCVYTGDKPYQHWGRGTNWSAKASFSPLRGRTYDLLSTEALIDRLSVHEGDLVLSAEAGRAGEDGIGMKYRALVVDLDDDTATPRTLRKIVELATAGATVILGSRRPGRSAELSGYPACDDEVMSLARKLWGVADQEKDSAPPARGLGLVGQHPDQVLGGKGIPSDVEGPWKWIHRRANGLDIYFVSGSGEADVTFRVADREPELWDPVTGVARPAGRWRTTGDGRIVVSLSLPENGSVFVVFRQSGAGHLPSAPAPAGAGHGHMDLAGPWTVAFEPGRGAPESAVFETLGAWNQHADPGIRHFSGMGTYRRSFELTPEQARSLVRLELGEVKCIARVHLNGKDLGVVWTAPWSVDLSGAAKAGRNDLEIDVVNTWVNRLIGDAALPPEKRVTKTNVTLQSGKRTVKVYQGFGSEDSLLPSGLLGPVRLVFSREERTPRP